jgi:hypothetical protein
VATIEADIKTALSSFDCPVVPDEYEGSELTYFIFAVDTHPRNYADNLPRNKVCNVHLHYIAPKTEDISTTKEDIIEALTGAGFSYPDELSVGDANSWHLIFEFEAIRGV